MIGVRYQKNGHVQLFVIFRYTDFYSPTGNFELREAVKLDFQEGYTVNVNIFKTNVFGIKELALTQQKCLKKRILALIEQQFYQHFFLQTLKNL